MSLISTLGAATEFRQGYITPFAPTNANLTRIEGYNVNVAYTPNTIYTGGIITFIATSNTGNFSGSSTSNVITVGNIDPFFTYTFDVLASSAGGNSPTTTTTNNVYISSNLIANGNVTGFTGNALSFSLSSNGTNLYVVTQSGRLHRYSRNTSTGQLTLLGTNTISGINNFTSVVFSADSNFAYITGANTSNNFQAIYKYTVANGNIAVTGNIGSVFGTRTLSISPDNKSVFCTGRYNTLEPFTTIYSRDINTGNLSVIDTLIPLSVANYSSATTLIKMIVTPDNKNLLQVWQNPANDRFLLNYDRNTSTQFCNLSQTINLTTQLASMSDLACSPDGNSVYPMRTSSIFLYSRNPTNGALTFVNDTNYGTNNGILPANSIMLVNNRTFNRDLGNGNLTTFSNSSSFTTSTRGVLVSSDTKNLYTLTNTDITIYNITS